MHSIEHLAITLSPPLEITIVRLPSRSWRLEGVEEESCCRRRHWGSRVATGRRGAHVEHLRTSPTASHLCFVRTAPRVFALRCPSVPCLDPGT
uniref:Uncharacterized protein n=1 Tax=Oryza glumipatula TaxID=40148 RepID=A0A0E0B8U3_9ORYZ